MSWIPAILLAVAAFALAAFVFRLKRATWSVLAAALALGLAGYATQARPDLPAAPGVPSAGLGEEIWQDVEARREFVDPDDLSRADMMMLADAMSRRGRQVEAAGFLRGIVAENPRDFEAWLALGNAMVAQAGGRLTPAAVLAFRRASAIKPESLAPGYSLGLAFVMEGQLLQARQAWAETLAAAPHDAYGRDLLVERLDRLDLLLAQVAAAQQGAPD